MNKKVFNKKKEKFNEKLNISLDCQSFFCRPRFVVTFTNFLFPLNFFPILKVDASFLRSCSVEMSFRKVRSVAMAVLLRFLPRLLNLCEWPFWNELMVSKISFKSLPVIIIITITAVTFNVRISTIGLLFCRENSLMTSGQNYNKICFICSR